MCDWQRPIAVACTVLQFKCPNLNMLAGELVIGDEFCFRFLRVGSVQGGVFDR